MVPRRVAVAAVALATLLAPALADASNRRIAISDYRWSDPEIELDLGEHVTWYWTGPDLMHSVTAESANAAGIDSDPQTNQPQHQLGDSFQASFDEPGTYVLDCKLHSTVRGEVTVSSTPGNPTAEPDPVPRIQVDEKAPRVRDLRLTKERFGRRGTNLRFALAERARVSAEIFRFDEAGRRSFAGYRTWKGYVGFNGVRFGGRSEHFRPRPGSYVARVSANDEGNNTSPLRKIHFSIRSR